MVFIAPSLCRNYISADVLFCRKQLPYISHANSKLCKSQINFTSFWFHHLLVQKSLVWKPNHSFFSNPWFIICNFGKWRSLVPPLPLHSPLDALSNLVWHSDMISLLKVLVVQTISSFSSFLQTLIHYLQIRNIKISSIFLPLLSSFTIYNPLFSN